MSSAPLPLGMIDLNAFEWQQLRGDRAAPKQENIFFCVCLCLISAQWIPSLFALQVRNHTGVHGRAVSGVLHGATSWPDTSGSTPGQSHSNAVTVKGEQGPKSCRQAPDKPLWLPGWFERALMHFFPGISQIMMSLKFGSTDAFYWGSLKGRLEDKFTRLVYRASVSLLPI